MSSQYSGKSHSQDLAHDLQEKSPPAGQPCQTGGDPDRSSSAFHGPGMSFGLAEGLANLKLIVCQNCLARCGPSDGYQTLPGNNHYDYGTNKPYMAEKPPSTQFSGPPLYVPTSIATDEPTAFACDEPSLSGQFLPSYHSMQDTPSLASQPSNREAMAYPSNPTLTTYYGPQPPVRDVPAPSLSLNASYDQSQDHVMGSDQMPVPYSGGMMAMASSQSIHRQGVMPVASVSRPGLMTGFGVHDIGVHAEETNMHDSTSNLVVVSPNQNQRPAAAKRGPFTDSTKREETAQTRRIGSCVRCRMQRIRCKVNPSDTEGPCLTCKEKVSPKVWRVPCLRVKITDIKLFKAGQVHGYEWTQRWKDSIVDNIASWASSEVKTIHVSEGYTSRSVQLRVRRFVPQEGDKLVRSWVHDGVKKSVPIPPYAIIDLDEAQNAYDDYINRGIAECFDRVVGPREGLMWRTYFLAWRTAQDTELPEVERKLLSLTLRLWMAVRLTTQSAIIVGEETLGMTADIMDETSPLHGRIPLPPVMGAQLDMVLIHHIQMKLRRDLLEELQKMTQKSKQQTWLTTYLVTFILLHNSALITKHDAGYARKHGIKRRFAREDDVQEYHLGANILLAYFHYCNKGIYPFSDACRDQDLRALAELDERKVQFVQYTRNYASGHKREWEDLQRRKAYEDDYFFVSQLFEENWQPQTSM